MSADGSLKKALVTGGSRGIGSAICRALARDGYFVYINYRTHREEAEALARELGGEAVYADVSREEDVLAMAEHTGPVEVLVNNAGIAHYGLLQDMTAEEWRRIFAVNIDSVFLVTRAYIPGMVHEHRGSVVNLSSVWGVHGGSCEAAYSATKGAVIALTRALAKELGPAGIRVNAIAPGVIDTDMVSHLSEEDRAALSDETPLERLGTTAEAAEAAAFLASDRAAFVTGQILGCDGGFGL